MDSALHEALARWEAFYLITGSAAAALTGLQFVVQTLIASDAARMPVTDDPEAGISAFGTPTVVHFALAMVVSAVMCAPWPNSKSLHVTLAALALGALAYLGIVTRRAWRQTVYKTEAYDWFWYVILPIVAYLALMVSGLAVEAHGDAPFFVVAGSSLLLVCVGIHNAWDTVTFLTVAMRRAEMPRPAEKSAPPLEGVRPISEVKPIQP